MAVLTLLSATLAGAVAADVTAGEFTFPSRRVESLTLHATFTRAGGGTTAKAWVQTTLDGGTTWMDIANFAFTTSSAKAAHHLTAAPVAAVVTPADAALADNTLVNGFLGERYRVKLTTTGTYTGASSFVIHAMAK